MPDRLTGLIVATFSPFHADGRLNLGAIEAQCAAFLAMGVQGVFVNGTTGEGASMTVEERQAVAGRWQEVAGAALPVIVQVGANSLPVSQALAAHAQQMGAAAISYVAPTYFKPATLADLVDISQIVAAAAPQLPFYYYHIPMRTGLDFPVTDILRAARGRIPTLRGAKFSHPDLMDLLRALRLYDGQFDLLMGLDEMLLPAMALGIQGAVGTTYNFAAGVYQRLMTAVQQSQWERARKEQHRAAELIACLNRYRFMPAAKAVMAMIDLECGPVRLPLRSLCPEQRDQLRAELEALGFFQWR